MRFMCFEGVVPKIDISCTTYSVVADLCSGHLMAN